jgi:hypothetical protein
MGRCSIHVCRNFHVVSNVAVRCIADPMVRGQTVVMAEWPMTEAKVLAGLSAPLAGRLLVMSE